MFILVATPIGNLGDISQRALDALRQSDLILCEDTRHSSHLLRHFGIEKPLLSLHQFNEKSREERILRDLEEGRTICLISDAGTPLVSDPGFSLVRACIEKKIPFTAIPGPCSLIQALVLSGFESERFQFIGFLPRKKGALQEALRSALSYRGTSIAFESPERLIETLEEIHALAPRRETAVARELTKKFEECCRGTPEELLAHFRAAPPRGEIVLLLRQGELAQEEIPLDELIELLQEHHGLSLKEAIKIAASLKKLPKKEIYKSIHC